MFIFIVCSDKESTKALFERVQPTHVIHLAAKVGGLFSNMRCKVEFYRENIIMNDVVLELCKEYKVRKTSQIADTLLLG